MSAWIEFALSNAVAATGVAVVAFAVTRAWRRPEVAFAMWLLVLIKLLMPAVVRVPLPEIDLSFLQRSQTQAAEPADPWIVAMGMEPAANAIPLDTPVDAIGRAQPSETAALGDHVGESQFNLPPESHWTANGGNMLVAIAPWVWLAGSALWFAIAAIRIFSFHRALRRARPANEEIHIVLRRLAHEMGLAQVPRACVTRRATPPLVWVGLRGATILLPEQLLHRLDERQRKTLLAHELAHLKRRDHLSGWLALVVLGLYWWHPVAWFARRNLERAAEQCCDARVLSLLPALSHVYAAALMATLDFLAETRPAMPPATTAFSQVGLIKRRMEMILAGNSVRRSPWRLRLGLALTALAVLPFSINLSQAKDKPEATKKQPAASKAKSETVGERLDRLEQMLLLLTEQVAAIRASQTDSAQPTVVSTVPAAGATDVDPNLTEIKVTFSKDMRKGSWSWTSRSDETYPEITGEIHYEADQRTCVLPVKLQPGKEYWIGINSARFGNFKDKNNLSAVPFPLTFKTKP